jgi:hypothetical protein
MIETNLSSAPSTEEQFLHDVRAIADVVDINLAAVGMDAEALWVVVQTFPEAHSGSATLHDVAINGATGRLVGAGLRTGGLQADVVREGKWRILEVLSGTPPTTSGHYNWSQPWQLLTRGLSREDVYDPFIHPATMLCLIEPASAGRSSFHQISVLPEGWAELVADAVSAAHQIGLSPDEPATEATYGRLRSLLESPNELLLSTSIAALTRGQALDADTHDELLGRLNGYQRSVLHYMTLCHGQYLGRARIIGSLARAWEPSVASDHRRAATLGLVAARLLAPRSAIASIASLAPTERLADRAGIPLDDGYIQRGLELLAGD